MVTVWKGEKYLAEALDSVFAQTYRAIEVIIVDDGSTDRREFLTVLKAHLDRSRLAGPGR